MPENYSWGDKVTVAEEKNFTLFDEGEYGFTVSKFERGVTQKGASQATYFLKVTRPDGVSTTVRYRIPLIHSCDWKRDQFMKAIGKLSVNAGAGFEYEPDWDGCVGLGGMCELNQYDYVDKNNKVAKGNDVVRVWPNIVDSDSYGTL